MTTTPCAASSRRPSASERTVRTIVVDNGSDVTTSVVLASLPQRYRNVQVLSNAVNHGFALGNNLAMPAVDGEFVIFLNNDTEVTAGLARAAHRCAGRSRSPRRASAAALPRRHDSVSGGGLSGRAAASRMLSSRASPRLDAAGLAGPLLGAHGGRDGDAARGLLEMRGFDPLFRNGMEDVDLGLRMVHERDGHFVVRPDSIVVHHESRTPGRFAMSLANRRILLDRWRGRLPGDDVELWRRVGYEVVRHDRGPHVSEDRRLSQPIPILRRCPVITAVEPSGRLCAGQSRTRHQTIRRPSSGATPTLPDTVAAALRARARKSSSTTDPRSTDPAAHSMTSSSCFAGVAPYRPQHGQINLGWLISHPEMLSRSEASSYDRLFAASAPWADETSRAWGLRVDPLLQATDPSLFDPGPSTSRHRPSGALRR